MKTRRWRKGVILLQTLVMSVVLSMIAVMVLKWVLSRYMLTARNYRATTAKVRTDGCASKMFATWNFNTSMVTSSGNCGLVDGKTITDTTSGAGNTMRTFVFTTNEDL